MVTLSPERMQKFWSQIDKFGECWLWQGCVNKETRYGVFTIATKNHQGITRAAHLISYELTIGPVLQGNHVHHTCGVKLCVNPAHLEMIPKGEHSRLHNYMVRRQTHCKRGHPLSGDNIYSSAAGRACRSCARISFQARYWRKHERQPRTTNGKGHFGVGVEAMAERNAEMVARWVAGETTVSIAKNLQISSERVCQILARAGCNLRRTRMAGTA